MKKQEIKKIIFPGVLGLIINREGKYLLTRRNEPGNERIHHKWQLPGGGLEFGESVEQVLAREMEEELKISVRILFPYPIVKTHIYDYQEKKIEVLLLCYLCDIGGQKPEIGDPETAEFGWFTADEAQKLDYLPLTIEFIVEAEKILKREKILEVIK